jgi:hypothetical protein
MKPLPKMRYVPVTFPYSVVGVPKGCRVEREAFSEDQTSAGIEVARPADTRVAFRVQYPADNRLRYVYPDQPLSDEDYRARSRIEIIRYGGNFWWPIRTSGKGRYDVLSLQQALEQLESLHVDILNMIPLKLPKFERHPLQMRSISEDRSGQAEAVAQRAVAENLLICGDRIYARGGEPIYIKVSHGRSRTWEMAVVDPGFSRRIDPDKIGERRSPFDQYLEWWVQDAFRNGLLWRADMVEHVESLAHRMQSDIPTIDVIGTDPPSEDTNRVVTDALFRRAMLLVDRFYREADAILSKASEIRSIDEETTEARRRGLREFFGTPREVHAWKPMMTLHEQFRRFEGKMGSELLSPEDEEALVSLGV